MNNEINILELAKVLIKKWWALLLCAVVFGIAAYLYTHYFIQPIYISQGLLYVNSANSYNIVTVNPNSQNNSQNDLSLNSIYASQRLAMTNIEILKSDTFMDIIIRKTGLNISPARLKKLIAISAVNETEILQIKVSNTNPKEAAVIAQTILENANDEITRVVNGGSAEIIDNASHPSVPSSPNTKKNSLIGVLLGLVLGVIIVYLADLLNDHVKNQEELTRKYELPVLGIIPSFRSRKKSGYYNYYSAYEAAVAKPPVNTNQGSN